MIRSCGPTSATALLLSVALGLPQAAYAMRVVSRDAPPVKLTLVDRHRGDTLPTYAHRGTQWVAGEPGSPYAIRLTNTTNARVLVVLSVDGVNAVTGDTADPSQAGYVLAPWQITEIAGWRKSHGDVARFVFTDLPDSYAARTGRPDNVGTIGIAVFRERSAPPVRPMPSPPIARERQVSRSSASRAAAAPGASADRATPAAMESAIQARRIGTGHGGREWAPVAQTSFVRATRHPAHIVTLRYDAPDVLAAMGLRPPSRAWLPVAPQAFPGGFVADPPGAD